MRLDTLTQPEREELAKLICTIGTAVRTAAWAERRRPADPVGAAHFVAGIWSTVADDYARLTRS